MKKKRFDNTPYILRFKISMITTLVITILVFKYGPEMNRQKPNFHIFDNNSQITIDLIEITTQSTPPSAPPKPKVPVSIVTDLLVIETDIDLIFDVPIQLDPGIERIEGQSVGLVVRNPQRSPRVQRIVEPVSPERSSNIEIIAELTVGIDGRVEEVEIVSIRRRNSANGQMETLDQIEESYLQATREAAFQWLFRPATNGGKPVRSVSEHVFTFGRGIN